MLAVGNKSCITQELFNICTKKATKIGESLNRISDLEKKGEKEEDVTGVAAELAKLKKELEEDDKGENKERSIYGIQYDLPRTFPELGIFKQGGGFFESLEQVLEAFVVSRPDIGYVNSA